jgi:hypothetical protein
MPGGSAAAEVAMLVLARKAEHARAKLLVHRLGRDLGPVCRERLSGAWEVRIYQPALGDVCEHCERRRWQRLTVDDPIIRGARL